ncbi:hypothetical protein ES703_17879 [subsurface metagenome]
MIVKWLQAHIFSNLIRTNSCVITHHYCNAIISFNRLQPSLIVKTMVQSVVLGTRIPPHTDFEIKKVIEEGKYLSKADFLRVAVRTELAKAKEDDK